MSTALITHEACFRHTPAFTHPERPERLGAVINVLKGPDYDLEYFSAPQAMVHQLTRIHPQAHVEEVMARFPQGDGTYYFDGDTVASGGTREAVLRAVGAVIKGVDLVMRGTVDNAFCAIRPPGHHAEPNRVMGFCFFNNAAIGASYAHDVHKCARVAVIDFDVHHGNGTQKAFWNTPHLFYASSHQGGHYPGTGLENETGCADNIVNYPLPAFADSKMFRNAYERRILPALRHFDPSLVIMSAGFDAHTNDPLAHLRLMEDDFYWVTEQLCTVARDHCDGRVVSVLEGGYDLEALGSSVGAHVKALMAAGS